MPHSSISPMSVVPYGRDYIIDFVRYITNWSQRGEVESKPQLNYLCRYLEVNHIDCKTIVLETDYVDRHFLEDYSEYYARCFSNHPRRCSRMHFFSKKFTETKFRNHLEESSAEFSEELKSSYLGFIVIRPIPHTFFAKICIKPYAALLEDPQRKILYKDVDVSLFGLSLRVKTIPFVEQDKVVSACATSAVWTALSAGKDMAFAALPSPSAITKSASHAQYDGARTFPTPGLSKEQIARALKHHGLEPFRFWEGPSTFDELKAHIYSYVSNSFPVLLGGRIFKKGDLGYSELGSHLVCVVGYSIGSPKNNSVGPASLNLKSNDMDKLYVHDDRIGPYVKIALEPVNIISGGKDVQGFKMGIHDEAEDIFVPDLGIVGLYHKIRIMQRNVLAASIAFQNYLQVTPVALRENKLGDEADILAIERLLEASWEVALTTNIEVKDGIKESKTFTSFNGASGKGSVLLPNMPRYVWRCRLASPGGATPLMDILFDATEVPQGRTLIGYVSYNSLAERVWNVVAKLILDRLWQDWSRTWPEHQEGISCFFKFFDQNMERTYLNIQYGPLGLPRRSLKEGESDQGKNITKRNDIHVIRRGAAKDWNLVLNEQKKYIWVINEFGDIVLGEDIHVGDVFKGHPTLIDGKPGRLGGEISFKNSKWMANTRSRTYSAHLDDVSAKFYLEQVIKTNFGGLQVEAEVDQQPAEAEEIQ